MACNLLTTDVASSCRFPYVHHYLRVCVKQEMISDLITDLGMFSALNVRVCPRLLGVAKYDVPL
jgi:hypothetical protein